VNAGVMV